ncbi:NADH dehydrogenase protein [Marine Group I thaumarchaeote SCGC AAA799-E16]|uniref:Thiosulfate sulfurtransferase GlpE protein n=2 Tax=Marine Group I TaxID=905826 RepID=A0A087RSW1_9ARCH|nr:NADH dehydrogenase protein [Marine Group I thaumarchaeote SCGC AAA799-E16]KFM16565.1 Thiosulfate sulfurtransferase GlpE protein [Marine Group I thaumarchaeote SCGC RSA3]
METRNLVIVAGIVVAIAIVGVMTMSNTSLNTVDILAVDYGTVDVLLTNNERVFVVDIRSAEQYQTGHIVGASHDVLSGETLEKRVKTIQNRLPEIASTYNIVLVDDDGIDAKHTAQTMNEMGIQTFYLDGGMKNLSTNLESSPQIVIDSQELSQKLAANNDLFLLDVREPDELLQSKIDGSVNIPLAEIFDPDRIDEIPTDKPVVVICGSGNRATIATYALAQEDVDFQVLEGGIKAWNSFQESGI